MSNEHATLRAANSARQQEWDTNNQITLAYRGNELAGEVGEACNVIKKLERERMGIRGSRDTVDHLAEELADVVICCDLIAMGAGIDLDAAVREKFNATSEKVGLATRLVNAVTDVPSNPRVALLNHLSRGKPQMTVDQAVARVAELDFQIATYPTWGAALSVMDEERKGLLRYIASHSQPLAHNKTPSQQGGSSV